MDFSAKALGGLLPISGAVGSKEVTADKNGHWTAPDLPLKAEHPVRRQQRHDVYHHGDGGTDSDGNAIPRRRHPCQVRNKHHP